MSPMTFVELAAPTLREPIEVLLRSGHRLRLAADFDALALERLLQVLERQS